ncbi:MAG: hypothetical protein ACREV2_03510, partial [Burkholderiales bacterium]
MNQVIIRIPMPLRSYTDGAEEVSLTADSVGGALRDLIARHGGLSNQILSQEGELRQFVNVFLS